MVMGPIPHIPRDTISLGCSQPPDLPTQSQDNSLEIDVNTGNATRFCQIWKCNMILPDLEMQCDFAKYGSATIFCQIWKYDKILPELEMWQNFARYGT